MTFSDDEEKFGFFNVYHCKKCDKAKPRKDFHKMYDRVKIEEVFYKFARNAEIRQKQPKKCQQLG